jgi:hypothetical protein
VCGKGKAKVCGWTSAPFAKPDVLRKRGKIKREMKPGKEPVREKKDFPSFWKGSEFTGERVNDVHLSLDRRSKA